MPDENQERIRKTDIEIEHIRGKLDLLFTDFQTVSRDINEIKDTIKGLNGLKEKVKYLDKWHWIVVVGIMVSLIITIVSNLVK